MERVTEAAVRRQRVIQTTLLFIILATLPCYCVGFVLLGVAPKGQRSPNATVVSTSTSSTSQPVDTLVPSITPYAFATFPNNTLSPLLPTPTQIQLFPTFTLSWTPIPPTRMPTITPIVIIPPTITPIIVPTSTHIIPSATPITPTVTKAPPTATTAPPTATTAPPTATTAPPTATTEPPTATETVAALHTITPTP